MRSVFLGVLGISALCHDAVAALPGTRPLTVDGDRSAQMITGISRFLDRQIESAAQQRSQQELDPNHRPKTTAKGYWRRGSTPFL